MRPAERVDDVAVVRALLDGAADHLHALVEIDALIDPRIAEIVQHMRLIEEQLERRFKSLPAFAHCLERSWQMPRK